MKWRAVQGPRGKPFPRERQPSMKVPVGMKSSFQLCILWSRVMKQDPIDEHAAREALPTEAERNYGVLTAGVVALVVIGTAVYGIS
jgi:hypothetical protein